MSSASLLELEHTRISDISGIKEIDNNNYPYLDDDSIKIVGYNRRDDIHLLYNTLNHEFYYIKHRDLENPRRYIKIIIMVITIYLLKCTFIN